jgi:hypothetical protein
MGENSPNLVPRLGIVIEQFIFFQTEEVSAKKLSTKRSKRSGKRHLKSSTAESDETEKVRRAVKMRKMLSFYASY